MLFDNLPVSALKVIMISRFFEVFSIQFDSRFSKISLERTSYASPVITRAALFCNLSDLLIWRLLSPSFQIVEQY